MASMWLASATHSELGLQLCLGVCRQVMESCLEFGIKYCEALCDGYLHAQIDAGAQRDNQCAWTATAKEDHRLYFCYACPSRRCRTGQVAGLQYQVYCSASGSNYGKHAKLKH